MPDGLPGKPVTGHDDGHGRELGRYGLCAKLQLSGDIMFNKAVAVNPPIFADLLVEVNGQIAKLDVEQKGYLEQYQAICPLASRVGLALRGSKKAAVWVAVNGNAPRYYSQVTGEMFGDSAKQVRVACLDSDSYKTWLHKDGTVEVAQEPTVKL